MEDVVKAIEKLAEKNWVDYSLIIVPILISVISIYISIHTANKQNKIALYQLRYKALCRLNCILMFDKNVLEYKSSDIIINGCNLFFKMDLQQGTSNEDVPWDQYIKATSCLSEIDNDLSILYCTITDKQKESIDIIMGCLADIIASAISGEISEEKIITLHAECSRFSDKEFKKLEKKIKI